MELLKLQIVPSMCCIVSGHHAHSTLPAHAALYTTASSFDRSVTEVGSNRSADVRMQRDPRIH
jgi:hypothetical protein